jgi:CRP/FNR family cyclic AMP-dependent transcriptional regulator
MGNLLSKLFGKSGVPESESEILHILKKVPIFEDLSDGELIIVENIMHRREFGTGEVMMHQGAAGHGMYIIIKGTVTIAHSPTDPPLAELHDGDFIGEMALLDNSPRSASAVAKTSCMTLSFFRPDMFKLIEANPKLGAKVLLRLAAIIGDRLRNTNEQVKTLQYEIAELKKK